MTKILVVDDSNSIRDMVSFTLKSAGYLTVEAKDGQEGLSKAQSDSFDLVISDVNMPNMDGITLCAELRKLPSFKFTPILMLTTESSGDMKLKGKSAGATGWLVKPFNPEKLLATIKRVLLSLPNNSPAVVITQHIPKAFSARFAERLNENCVITVHEAQHGQKIKEGNAYIAPGDQHLTVVAKGGSLFCALEDSEPVNRHKPAVDVLFTSLTPMANNVQAVLLTGMGQDGAKGMLALKNEGARTMIQDKNSSLIWGMPGSAYALNAHTDEVELNKVASKLLKYAELDRNEMKEVLHAK